MPNHAVLVAASVAVAMRVCITFFFVFYGITALECADAHVALPGWFVG